MSRRTGKHRIYMNVGYDLTEQQLRDFFNQYGTVTDVYLPKHKSGRNKGFGFTTFDSEESLRSALSAQEYMIGGDVVKINRAGPRPEFEAALEAAELAAAGADGDAVNRQPQLFGKGPRLYVGGVPEELTEERLKAHFSRWGNVVDLYFPGKKGQSRVNYCFVTFDNWRAAQRACNQSERNIDGLPLQSINLAQERTAEQEQQARAEAVAVAAAAAAASATGVQPKSLPIAASGAAADFDVGDPGSAPNLLFLQHLQMQAQLQAQQFGYAPQQHAQLQGILAGQGIGTLPPALSAYPAAYQQMLNSLLAQQSAAAVAMPPGMYQNPSSASLHAYDLSATTPAPRPFLGSMPLDLGQLLAVQAQAAEQHARNAQPSVMPDASQRQRGIPLGVGMGSAPSLQPASGDLASSIGWGWGNSASNSLIAEMPRGKVHPSLQGHPDLMLGQAQAHATAAASAQSENVGPVQLPYGVLNLEGFGPLRSIPGRHRNNFTPY